MYMIFNKLKQLFMKNKRQAQAIEENQSIEMHVFRKSMEKSTAKSNYEWNKTTSKQTEFFSLFAKVPYELKSSILSYIHPDHRIAAAKFKPVSKDFTLFGETLGEEAWLSRIADEFKLTNDKIKKYKQKNETYVSLYNRICRISRLCTDIREHGWDLKQLGGDDTYYEDYKNPRTRKDYIENALALGEKKLQEKSDKIMEEKLYLMKAQENNEIVYNSIYCSL